MLVNYVLKVVVAAVVVGLMAGCAAVQKAPQQHTDQVAAAESTTTLTADFSRSKLIAADFASTLIQIPETDPTSIILHAEKPVSRFGELLLAALQSAGFDLRVGEPSSDFWLSYAATRDAELSIAGNPIYTFIVAAGHVKLKRAYEVDRYGIRPSGSMFVRGGSADNVVLDDSIFSVAVPRTDLAEAGSKAKPSETNADSEVTLAAVPTPKPLIKSPRETIVSNNASLPEPVDTMPTDEQLDNATIVLASASTGSTNTSSASTNSTSTNSKANGNQRELFASFSNMYDTRESRYKDIFKEYSVIGERVMIFPNDSLVMGRQNKQMVRGLAREFDASTDVLSVIGCSHGKSEVQGGNGYLANSRAFRVKEEFIAAGVESSKVLEEGCWANVEFKKMPSRGVVVRHKRIVTQ